MQEKTPQLSVAASLCKLLLNRMLEKFIDQHSQCLCYVVESLERRVSFSVQPLADHRLRDIHAQSELFGIYVFSHITFSSCSCDSYFFCFIAFILKMIHKNGTANAVPQMLFYTSYLFYGSDCIRGHLYHLPHRPNTS